MTMRVADYAAEFLASKGIDCVFMVAGGMSMNLVDAFAHHPKIRYYCTHHEQAAVLAAEGYARQTRKVGAACVTAGPGATNTLTGMVGAYFDSVPLMLFAGQTKASEISWPGIRQFGVQGFETLPIFKHASKYAVLIDKPGRIRYELEKAYFIATSGRPGPVWIEIPSDIQGAPIEPSELGGFTPPNEPREESGFEAKVEQAAQMLAQASRPLILLGNGVRLAGAEAETVALCERLGIPIITSRLGIDIIASDHPLFVGRPGLYGTRPAHFAIQNADLVVSIGCRLCRSLVGYNYKEFAKNGKKIVVDIDSGELGKLGIDIDVPILADAGAFIRALAAKTTKNGPQNRYKEWADQCRRWREKYPTVLPEYNDDSQGINSYYLVEEFSRLLKAGDTWVVDTSSIFHVAAQAAAIKKGETYITTGGLSEMGYALPAAIGVAASNKLGRTLAITGDGSLQMNIHELQTLVNYKLPVKLCVLSNNGYLLIRHTQRNFMEDRFVGESPASGLSCPDLAKIAQAYGIKYRSARKTAELGARLREFLSDDGPQILEVFSPVWQKIEPRVASKKMPDGSMMSMAYDDMSPFLERSQYGEESGYYKKKDRRP